jgi:dTMP kinase
MTGRFVVIEGGDGSGKSTQAKRLVARLHASGRDALLTHEPGDTELGQAIRGMLLHADWDLDARSELLLMLADRAQHVAEVVRPALAAGSIVVSDRYTPSSMTYQGVGRSLGVDEIRAVSDFASAGLEPDLTIVLDLPDEAAAARVAVDGDRMERAGETFHAAVRNAYRELAARYGWAVVDARGTRDVVAGRVWAAVEAIL